MKEKTLELAILEAHRFIERAKEAQKEGCLDYCVGTRATGAVKRASMDLTRVLADLRLGR